MEKLEYKYDDCIFKFINPQANNQLSELHGLDLQDLIWYIDNYYLELRNILGLDEETTFGLELEFENSKHNKLEKLIKQNLENWEVKDDVSLDFGIEINSPILRDTHEAWQELKQICDMANGNAEVDIHSGGHIHVGSQILGKKRETWLNFFKLWSVYENIIFRFVYGDHLVARPNILRYAEPRTKDFWRYYSEAVEFDKTVHELIIKASGSRRYAVNLSNVRGPEERTRNTIEFRCPNSSLDPVVWQNNVNLFVKLLEYTKNTDFNDDIVTKRHEINGDKYTKIEDYNEIYLDQALEFADLVFDNNLDKIYFLRQYLKSLEIGNKELQPAKVFTKEKRIA